MQFYETNQDLLETSFNFKAGLESNEFACGWFRPLNNTVDEAKAALERGSQSQRHLREDIEISRAEWYLKENVSIMTIFHEIMAV